jgi:hypothetical protein
MYYSRVSYNVLSSALRQFLNWIFHRQAAYLLGSLKFNEIPEILLQTRRGETAGDGPTGGDEEEGDGATNSGKTARRRTPTDPRNRLASGRLQRVSPQRLETELD